MCDIVCNLYTGTFWGVNISLSTARHNESYWQRQDFEVKLHNNKRLPHKHLLSQNTKLRQIVFNARNNPLKSIYFFFFYNLLFSLIIYFLILLTPVGTKTTLNVDSRMRLYSVAFSNMRKKAINVHFSAMIKFQWYISNWEDLVLSIQQTIIKRLFDSALRIKL